MLLFFNRIRILDRKHLLLDESSCWEANTNLWRILQLIRIHTIIKLHWLYITRNVINIIILKTEILVCRINQPCICTVCRTVGMAWFELTMMRLWLGMYASHESRAAGWDFSVVDFLLFFMWCANVWFINGCGGWSVFDECQKWNSWMPWNMGADVLLSFSCTYSITALYVKDRVV